MRWIVLVPAVLSVVVGACGGPKVPAHSGYKNEKAKPWGKPKALVLDEKSEAKADGDLSYRDFRRARWFSVTLPSNGELKVNLEITPPGEAVNDNFDLALEVLDPGFRVISKSDLEEADANELAKAKTLVDLVPGRYLIHIYLQNRMDTAEYSLRVAFRPTAAAEVKTTFPSEVEFVPRLAKVPETDDTPKSYKGPTAVVRTTTTRRPQPVKTEPKPEVKAMTARITAITVAGNQTRITIGIGTAGGAADGMNVKLKGIAGQLVGCTEKRCSALVSASPDQVRAAGDNVVVTP